MAQITGTDNSDKPGFVKLSVTLSNGSTVVKDIPASIVATVDSAKVYLAQLDRQASTPRPIPPATPTDFSFLHGLSNQ